MRRITWNAATVAVVALAGTISSGCGSSPGASSATLPRCLVPGAPVAVAMGYRSNSPEPNLTPGILAVLNSAIAAHRMITIIRLDGDPMTVFSKPFIPQGPNSETKQRSRDNYIKALNPFIEGTGQAILAQAPQVNDLEALAKAASTVQPGGNVIMMDSGLQTTEPLDFTTGLLADDPQTIASSLKRAGELPGLTGLHVYFVGLGWVRSPQPTLDPKYQKRVVQIWEDIAMAAGARCVAVDPTDSANSASANRPPVAAVTPPHPAPSVAPCAVIPLNDANNVGFTFDSTIFRNPDGARATLRQIANLMLRTGESVILTGSTSSEGSDQYNLGLSRRRASAVKALLMQLGVPSSRVTAIGDGSHMHGRLNDRSPNGQLLIGPAIHDREVVAKLTGPKCH